MNSLKMPTFTQSADWYYFGGALLILGLGIVLVAVWFFSSGGQKKRKRRHRHERLRKPTLAEAGGLPPKRDQSQPPRGV